MRLSFPYRRPRAVRAVLAAATATTALALVAANAPAANAVIGGTEVPNDAYPFTVAVLDKGPGSVKDRQFCGGSLVAPDTVMTAAHCLVDDHRKPVKPKAVQTAVGRTVLSRAGQGRIRDVAEDGILVHPRYLRGKDAYDLAFIKLSKPVRGISAVRLPTRGTDSLLRPGQKATVVGWGNTDTELTHQPDRMRQVRVPILSHAECRTSYADYDAKVNFCAGVEGKDSCQGDSGGPVFREVPGREAPILIGVVSYGEGCGDQGAPGVYTSTSSSKLWQTLGGSAEAKRIKRALARR